MKPFFSLLLACCITAKAVAQEKIDDRDVLELKSRMEGMFSNQLQALADKGYAGISIHSGAIWTRSEDGYWLYCEERFLSASRPYAQYVRHLFRKDDITIVCQDFLLPDPLRFAGAIHYPDLLLGVTKDSLINKVGCELYFQKNAQGDFNGISNGKLCGSGDKNAAYQTQEIKVFENKMLSWQRGWDENGRQVWGPITAGCQFDKAAD